MLAAVTLGSFGGERLLDRLEVSAIVVGRGDRQAMSFQSFLNGFAMSETVGAVAFADAEFLIFGFGCGCHNRLVLYFPINADTGIMVIYHRI